MYKQIKELFSLLSSSQRNRFYRLQILVVVMAFTEVIGIASISPFMALVGNIDLLQSDNILGNIYQLSGLTNPYDFLLITGIAVLMFLTLATFISMFTTWRLALFSSQTGIEIADRLYKHYMCQPWLFHASNSSAQLTKQISTEALRVTVGVIQPLMFINSRLALAIFISLAIFLYNPIPALVGVLLFVGAYVVLFKIVRIRLQSNGAVLSLVSTQRFRLMNEGFGGIKDVLLLGRNDEFIQRFEQSGVSFSQAQSANTALGTVPRYFMELMAFGSMIALVLIMIRTQSGDLGTILPILSVYALAGFKLLPALQQIYTSLTQVKGNIAAFESIKLDLHVSKFEQPSCFENIKINDFPIVKQSIELNNLTFTYPNKTEPSIKNLSIKIPVNSVIGIVGPSGSGKSTIIDLLLGLIQPQQGSILLDKVEINDSNRRAWQNTIGFVPQSIFLSEGSIAENIAFGVPKDKIDFTQIAKAAQLSHLDEFVKELPKGLHSEVGERGVQLSGGQRQRIGIARALYHEANTLIFDEATSALDGITEKLIMEAINEFSGKKTIIMIAHRLKTVEKCDIIFYIDRGRLVDQGSYEQLIASSSDFKRMSMHT